MLARSRVALLIFGALFFASPFVASAVGTAADAMCNPVILACPCGQVINPKGGCKPGANMHQCPCFDVTNSFTTSGKCVAPNKCLATATSDGKLDQGMAKLGEMLGKLMEMMKKQDGGGGGQGGTGNPTDTGSGCTTMQPTGTKTLADQNPMCYYYDPRMDPSPTEDPNAVDPSGGLVATPTDGPAPLKVTFAYTNGTTGCKTPTLLIDFGDGTSEQQPTHTGSTCSGMSDTTEHTYTTAGQYSARLKSASDGAVRGGVNLIVGVAATDDDNPVPDSNDDDDTNTDGTNTGGTNTGGTNTGTTGFTSGTLSNLGKTLFDTPLNNLGNSGSVTGGTNSTGGNSSTGGSASTGGTNEGTGASLNFNTPQSIVQSIIQKNLPPGAYGDVKILNNGTTIVAGVREKNSEVAGFYGTNTTTSAGGVQKLCATRPWATNFLSFIIPASFFDSLCTWRGYTVGTKTLSAPTTTTPKTTKTATTTTTKTPTTVKTTVGGTKSGGAATTTTPSGLEPRVDIWATPATVPLGARTSIFWNTQGVTECIETSPDGSFSHATLKGGASTVPLTSATTFTISCIAPNGTPVTDTVTVQMAL